METCNQKSVSFYRSRFPLTVFFQRKVLHMKLTMLGTGNALVTECYNTCFVLEENEKYFMVDGGGGSAILHQLKHAGFNWMGYA